MPAKRSRIILFAAGCFNCFLSALGMMVVPAMGVDIERELNITHASFGLAIGFFPLGVIAGYLPFLLLSGSKWVDKLIKAGLAALVAANLIAIIPSFWTIALSRFVVGMAWASATMAASLITLRYFEREQNSLFCVVHASFLVGSGLGMYLTPLAGMLLGRWQMFSLLLAGLGFLLLVAACVFPVELKSEKRFSIISTSLNCIFQKRVVLIILLLSVYCIVETDAAYVFSVYAQLERGLSLAQAANIVSLFLLGIVAGRLVYAFWLRWNPTIRGIAGLILAGCAFFFAAMVFKGYPALAGTMLMAGILFGPVYPLSISLAVSSTAEHKDVIVSAGNIVINIFCLAGLFAVGWIGDQLSLRFGLAAFCLLLAVLAASIGFAVRLRR